MSEREEDKSWAQQVGAVISLILNVLIFALIIWWLSSASAYLHDNVRSPDDPRRVKLRQLIDVSMGIAIVIIALTTLLSGKIFLGILELCAVIIPSVILSNYLKNTENPNFEQDFPSYWITAVIILNSIFGIAGVIAIIAAIVAVLAGEDKSKKVKLPTGLGTGSEVQDLKLRVERLEKGGPFGNLLSDLELDLEI